MIDPISNLGSIADGHEVKGMLSRVIDFLKNQTITTILTCLEEAGSEQTDVGISSLMDTWRLLRNIETSGERNRLLFVLTKSRHGAFEPGPRVPAVGQRHSTDRCL